MTHPEAYSLFVLRRLEAESIHIFREVAAECARPVNNFPEMCAFSDRFCREIGVDLRVRRNKAAPGARRSARWWCAETC